MLKAIWKKRPFALALCWKHRGEAHFDQEFITERLVRRRFLWSETILSQEAYASLEKRGMSLQIQTYTLQLIVLNNTGLKKIGFDSHLCKCEQIWHTAYTKIFKNYI